MIITAEIEVNGRKLIKTYSDAGMMIERDGVMYGEAVDPIDSGRVYTDRPGLGRSNLYREVIPCDGSWIGF